MIARTILALLMMLGGISAHAQFVTDSVQKPSSVPCAAGTFLQQLTTGRATCAAPTQNLKEAVKYATTAALPSVVYANGSSGVGATLTGVALAAISTDSSSPSVGDRLLVKNQASTFQNGIYIVTATGSGIAVFVLTRATDFDQSAEITTGDTTFVTAGATNIATTWAVNSADSPTMGTDAITVAQIGGPPTGAAGGDLTGTYPNPTVGTGKITVAKMAATGTPSASTYHRGDDTWAAAAGVGSPLANNGEIYVYAGSANAALGAPTPGQILIGVGTTNKLRYEAGYPDARYHHRYDEDFTGKSSTTLGTERIITAVLNSAACNSLDTFIGFIGNYACDTLTTTNGTGMIGAAGNGGTAGMRLGVRVSASGLNLWRASWTWLNNNVASDGTNTYTIKVGMVETLAMTGGNNNEVWIDYTHGTNSGKWVIREVVGGVTQTATNSTTAPAFGSLTVIDLELSGTTFTFYQNGTSIGTISTNSMSSFARLMPMIGIAKTAGTASRSFYWEHFTMVTELGTPIY